MDGVICKGNKVLIPSVMRPRIVKNIHSSHPEVENSIRTASDTLFWPLIRADIKAACENPVCSHYADQHQKEPMLSHPVPDLPWQYISQDILKHNSRYYFITVDHYSHHHILEFFLIHYLVYYTCEIHQQKETRSVLSNARGVDRLVLQCQLHLGCYTPLLCPQPK